MNAQEKKLRDSVAALSKKVFQGASKEILDYVSKRDVIVRLDLQVRSIDIDSLGEPTLMTAFQVDPNTTKEDLEEFFSAETKQEVITEVEMFDRVIHNHPDIEKETL